MTFYSSVKSIITIYRSVIICHFHIALLDSVYFITLGLKDDIFVGSICRTHNSIVIELYNETVISLQAFYTKLANT